MIATVAKAIMYTTLHGRYPAIRDRIVATMHKEQLESPSAITSTATAMMMTTGQAAVKKTSGTTVYPNDPATCLHENGLRQYAAGSAGTLQICDLCGSRWQKDKSKKTPTWVPVAPKAAGGGRSPLRPKASASSSQASRPSPSVPAGRSQPTPMRTSTFQPPRAKQTSRRPPPPPPPEFPTFETEAMEDDGEDQVEETTEQHWQEAAGQPQEDEEEFEGHFWETQHWETQHWEIGTQPESFTTEDSWSIPASSRGRRSRSLRPEEAEIDEDEI